MTRAVFVLLPLAGLLSAWAGRASGGTGAGFAYAFAVLVGLAVALALWTVGAARNRRLARSVNAWMGKLDVEPIEVAGTPDHRAVATALNTLGAAYARRGRRLTGVGASAAGLVAALPEPAVLFTLDGLVAAQNAAARDLLGAADEPGLGATQALGSPVLADLVAAAIAGSPGARDGREVVLGRRVVAARATPFAGHVLLMVRDLTDARRVAAVRRDFVTNASHELKTPVAGIRSLADALDVVVEQDPARARRLLDRLRAEADRLSTLVGDLLSLRRVDDGDAPVEAVSVDVERLAADVLASVALAADERGVEVALEVVGDGLRAHAAPEDLRLALANLVDNAVKYNRAGGRVTVGATREGEHVRIEVADTGIGIPAQDVERVFERFYRVDPGRSRDAGGTGLGLSIVRHAVERNGGSVEVQSLVGQGSRFIVWLPAGQDDGR